MGIRARRAALQYPHGLEERQCHGGPARQGRLLPVAFPGTRHADAPHPARRLRAERDRQQLLSRPAHRGRREGRAATTASTGLVMRPAIGFLLRLALLLVPAALLGREVLAAGTGEKLDGVWLIEKAPQALVTADGKRPPLRPEALAEYEARLAARAKGDLSF